MVSPPQILNRESPTNRYNNSTPSGHNNNFSGHNHHNQHHNNHQFGNNNNNHNQKKTRKYGKFELISSAFYLIGSLFRFAGEEVGELLGLVGGELPHLEI